MSTPLYILVVLDIVLRDELVQISALLQLVIVAGASGSLAAVALNRRVTWGEALSETFVGCVFAIYISPAICEYFVLQADAYQDAVAFANGVAGVIVLRATRTWLQRSKVIERMLAKVEEKSLGPHIPE